MPIEVSSGWEQGATEEHMTATLDNEVADLRRADAELRRRLNEALAERDEAEAQKAAMAEVMKVINSSPGDLAPVFDALLEKATVLCEASFGILMTYDGEAFQTVALRGVPAARPARTAPRHRSTTRRSWHRTGASPFRALRRIPARDHQGRSCGAGEME